MVNPLKAAFIPGNVRLGRADFLISWIISSLVLVLCAILTMMALSMGYMAMSESPAAADATLHGMTPLVSLIVIMPASIYCGSVLGVKRLHDMGRSGKWMIPIYLCYIGSLVGAFVAISGVSPLVMISNVLAAVFGAGMLGLVLAPGSRDKNAYGPVPPKF